jgi:hypothetical protein
MLISAREHGETISGQNPVLPVDIEATLAFAEVLLESGHFAARQRVGGGHCRKFCEPLALVQLVVLRHHGLTLPKSSNERALA